MARIRVKVHPPDAEDNAYHVHLPSWIWVSGTEEYTDQEKTKLNSVVVEVPDDECTDGKLDKDKIRRKYKGQPRWDREDVLDDI